MYAPQERNCIQHHCYRGQGLLLRRTRISCHGGRASCHGGSVSCHGGSASCRRGQGLFFLFIALCRMQNPIGGCCCRLKIPELARGIFRRLQHPWLARDILHPAQGVYPGFCLFRPTQGKRLSRLLSLPTDTEQEGPLFVLSDRKRAGGIPVFVFSSPPF